MRWYYSLLARRPYLFIMAVTIFCLTCITVALCLKKIPDFSNPTVGFEARGTELSSRLTAWINLEKETFSGKLSANPNEMDNFGDLELSPSKKIRSKKHKNKRKYKLNPKKKNKIKYRKENVKNLTKEEWIGDIGVFREYEFTNESLPFRDNYGNSQEIIAYGRNTVFVDEEIHRAKVKEKENKWLLLKQSIFPRHSDYEYTWKQGYFCGNPSKDYAHFVVKRIGLNATNSLFDLSSILAMCKLEETITDVSNYEHYCETEMSTGNCCKPWSIANYVGLLSNKSCLDLTEDDITNAENLLLSCFEYFNDLKLNENCNEVRNCEAPPECIENDLVFNILYYLADVNFIQNNETTFLRYAMIFVPVIQSDKILPLYHEWNRNGLTNELVHIEAMDLGLEKELFNELLLNDCCLAIMGGLFVLAAIWLYTSSLFVTLMTSIAVVFSLGLAYFIYAMVFEMSFFPYMNIMAIIVIIGIGADDAFIFMKIWETVLFERYSNEIATTAHILNKVENQNKDSLQSFLALSLRHSALSMFVTSLTTACAFFSSYSSHITAIKCFGIFAGIAVITNYFLMITWLPASISIKERLSSCNKFIIKLKVQGILFTFKKSIKKFCELFETSIAELILNYSWFWLILFGMIGLSSLIVVLYRPGISLPTKTRFQLFSSNHPFEIYDAKFKKEFWFEKSIMTVEYMKMPLRFVWGILPMDDGDYTDPHSYGNLHFDNNFNISTKASQTWLMEFCIKLRRQPFCEKTLGQLLPNCFIENFVSLMDRKCFDDMSGTNRYPCCEESKFPFEPNIFDWCLPQIISQLYATPREFFIPGVAGPKFIIPDKWLSDNQSYSRQKLDFSNLTLIPTPTVKALVISFDSNVTFSTNYNNMKEFKEMVDEWFKKELINAPIELKNAFFTSELKFFDIQDTLSNGTISAIAFSMCIALVVLLLATLNVLVSFYAVITICLSIFTTVAILIGLGWTLGILESVTVSTAIGLAVDFSLHFGIQYRMSPKGDRVTSAKIALERIVAPTAMAAVTTAFAGLFLMGSNVLAYIQIGVFLTVIMIISWVYSTFFLISLLKIAGPEYGFMQFHYPKMKKTSTPKPKYYERKPSHLVVSEQLLTPSSSAVGDMINSETHELESLNSHSNIKTVSCSELESNSKINK